VAETVVPEENYRPALSHKNSFLLFYHCVVCPSSIDEFWLYPLGIFKLFSLANIIPLCFIEYISLWSGFKLTILVVLGTDCTGNCRSHYHTIPIMPPEIWEYVCFLRFYSPHDDGVPFKCWEDVHPREEW
jgi:hypothetical protein